MEEIAERLTPDNHALALALANLPDQIRGFGHVKAGNLAKAREARGRLLADFRNPAPQRAAAE